MTVVFLFGNGLSVGFDRRLSTEAITTRVEERLGPELTSFLDDIAELAAPESPETSPIGVSRGRFERLAGPLDRVSDLLVVLEEVVPAEPEGEVARGLREASESLRDMYYRAVGTVLAEVDACCVGPRGDIERRASWTAFNEFTRQIVVADAATFTLSYDSLLMSSMLEMSLVVSDGYVYDGFRGGPLNLPLDRWSEPELFHLHGAVGWRRDQGGDVSKLRLEVVRNSGLLDEWMNGDYSRGWPSVLLGDLKTRMARRYPFFVMYEEFRRQLLEAEKIVVGGYSFGDRPVNVALAEALVADGEKRLLVWNRTGSADVYLERLRQQPDSTGIRLRQVTHEAVQLPDADAVREVLSGG